MLEKISVLYIMGAGRSGSTLLDTVLGNHPDIESVGELTNLPLSGWIYNEYCACGERANDCSYWSAVKQQFGETYIEEEIEEYIKLQQIFERVRYWPRLLKEQSYPSSQFHTYAQRTYRLFKSIQAVSGKPLIVDSSKYPIRAFALSMIPGIDLRIIHLIRDARGVAWSLKKSYKKNEQAGIQRDFQSRPVWRTAAFWTFTNLQSEWVRTQLLPEKFVQIRYEDFVGNPKETLEKIGVLSECNLTELGEALTCGKAMEVGHTIAGNRLRMTGSVKLRPELEWIQKMPVKEKQMAWSIAGWLMQRYGYTQQ